MKQARCEICGGYFETATNSKTCDNCKFEISQISKDFTYKERVKILKEQYKKEEEKKLSTRDKLLLFYCSKCLWCRKIDSKNRKIYCCLPRCNKYLK